MINEYGQTGIASSIRWTPKNLKGLKEQAKAYSQPNIGYFDRKKLGKKDSLANYVIECWLTGRKMPKLLKPIAEEVNIKPKTKSKKSK